MWITSALVVGALVLAAIVLAVTAGNDSDTSAARLLAPAAPAAADGARCPELADRDLRVPTSAPADTTWSLYRTVAMPYSGTAGPAVVEGDVARCYAHTPTGALIAAQQLSTRLWFAPDWGAVLDHGVQPGIGRDGFRRDRAVLAAARGPMPVPRPGKAAQLAGFRIASADPQTAVVQLVRRYGTVHRVVTIDMVWHDGDWRLHMQPSGLFSRDSPPVRDLRGFVVWGGV